MIDASGINCDGPLQRQGDDPYSVFDVFILGDR